MSSTHGQTPWEMLPAVQSPAPVRQSKRRPAPESIDQPEEVEGRSLRPGFFPDLDELRLTFDWPAPAHRSQRHL